MNKNRYFRVGIFSILILFCVLSLTMVLAAEPKTTILTAYATSATVDSTPVTELLDLTKEGLWKPQSKDAGSNEGIFYQFTAPVLIDWIEVEVKNGVDSDCSIDFYLDGKRNVSEKMKSKSEEDFNSDKVEYWSSYKNIGKKRLFYLGAAGRNDRVDVSCGFLNVEVKSVFIKISHAQSIPEFTAVRFYQKDKRDPISITIPKNNTGKVAVSSVLAPETAYGYQNLFDSRTDFAWATDGKRTNGVGETITIDLDNPQDLSGLIIWNGYHRSKTHYLANARPSKLLVRINDLEAFSISVPDKMNEQVLKFPKSYPNVKKLVLEVASVYPGTAYKDMVVSELKLMDQNGNPVVLNVPPINFGVANNLLKEMLDISLAPYMLGVVRPEEQQRTDFDESFYWAMDYPFRRLRIRSNGSFVAYLDEGMVAEGNWEPLSDGLRIFGKKYVTYYSDSIYMQDTKKDNETRIFQETIKIIDLSKTPYSEGKKYLKTLLAERNYYDLIAENPGPVNWWMGIEPHYKAKLTAKSEEELLKACYDKAAELNAFFLVSPMFTDLYFSEKQIVEPDGYY